MQRDEIIITNKWFIFLWLAIGGACLYFFMQGYWNHHGFLSSINDSGCFDQAIWNCSQGSSLINTSQFKEPIHWFSLHFQPILYLFVPLYSIMPTMNWLIMAQAFCLSFAAYPVFLATLHITREPKTSFVWSVVYLFNSGILFAAFWDFHPNSMAVPLMAFGMLSVLKKKPVMLVLNCLLLLLIKEHYGITVCAFALLYWLHHRSTLFSFALGSIGVITFAFVLGYIMPRLSVTGAQIMLSADQGQLSRYSWLGNDLSAIFYTVFNHPVVTFQTIFFKFQGLAYLLTLTGSFFFLSLLAPLFLLPAAADVLANMFSANMMPRSLISYHSAPLVPLFLLAAVKGAEKMTLYCKRYSSLDFALLCLIVPAMIMLWHPAQFPVSLQLGVWRPMHRINFKDHRMSHIQSIIKEKQLTVQANVGAHFSQRQKLYRYPQRMDSSSFILLHLQSPTTNIKMTDSKAVLASLAHHLQMNPKEFLETTQNLIVNHKYGIRYYNEPWILFEKGFKSTPDQIQAARKQLKILENKWQRTPSSMSQ